MSVTGISLGGGLIQVTEINGFNVTISMGMPTFVIVEKDAPGVLAKVTAVLGKYNINIAQMTATREDKGDKTIIVMEVDTVNNVEAAAAEMRQIPELYDANFFM